MAYRFKLSEPFEEGVKRIGIQQIDRAVEQLQSGQASGVAVHATRKGLKRIRSLLRLARPALGDSAYKHENARYRDISRLLSAQRDDVVLMETVSSFETVSSGRTKTAFAAAKARFSEGVRDANRQNGAVERAIAGLNEGRSAMLEFALSGHKFESAWEGLERAYRQTERALETATETRQDEDVHAWRKRVQYHWRHLMLLSAAWPEEMAVRIAAARHLSALLGQDHDISLMIASMADGTRDRLTSHQRKLAETFALERQAALRRDAYHISQRLFAESARAFRQRIETYWTSAIAGGEKSDG